MAKMIGNKPQVPKWMVLPGARPTSVGLLALAMNESFGGTIETAANPSMWRANCQCFLHQQDIGWSRSCVLVLRWSCEV
jgi:hypothetical protein